MAFHNLLSKCDQALVAYLISAGAGTANDVWPSKKSTDKTLPCTICKSHTGRPEGSRQVGNFMVEAMVYVRTLGVAETQAENEADVPRVNADDRVAKTFDAFELSDDATSGEALGILITNAAVGAGISNFTALSVEISDIEAGFEAKGDAWMDAIHLEILCCPKFIPES